MNIYGLGNFGDGRDIHQVRGERKVSRSRGWGLRGDPAECVLFHTWYLLYLVVFCSSSLPRWTLILLRSWIISTKQGVPQHL